MTARLAGVQPGTVVTVLLNMVLIASCASSGTGAWADRSTDFGAFRTFAWIDEEPYIETDAPGLVDVRTRSTIEAGIRRQLESRGYRFTGDRAGADLLVAFTVGSRDGMRMDAYPLEYRGHWGWHEPYEHYFFRNTSPRNYTRGTLGIDLFDNETGKPVWHGWADGAVPHGDRDDSGSTIGQGIAKLFASFPE